MNRAENGDVKRTFDVYGDFDGVQCGRGTQFMSRSLSIATPWRDSAAIRAVTQWT